MNTIKIKNPIRYLVLVMGILLVFPFADFIINLFFINRIFPNTKIAGVDVGGLTTNQAVFLISQKHQIKPLYLKNNSNTYSVPLNDIGISYDYQKTTKAALASHSSSNFIEGLVIKFSILTNSIDLPLILQIDEEQLNKFISIINEQVSIPGKSAQSQIINSSISFVNGVDGTTIDSQLLKNQIISNLTKGNFSDIEIPLVLIDNSLDESEINLYKQRLTKIIGDQITIDYEDKVFIIDEDMLASYINPAQGFNTKIVDEWLKQIEEKFNRQPQNSIFTVKNGSVVEFVPSKNGVSVNNQQMTDQIILATDKLINNTETLVNINLIFSSTAPDITNQDVNNLGINELIGIGKSSFTGSAYSRIHNIELAASRISGSLVAPDQIFSFNKTLGDVSTLTGYQQAYIIKDGQTILGDGGGVCQVSTTLFRAILNTGLPVVERAPHSYRVAYYEQGSPPGLDATVFDPAPDLKFKNDTGKHILIQAITDSKNRKLTFEIYGTSDGRVAEISKPVISSVTPPPEDLYIDDPNLPIGEVKQIDYKAWGAKVYFDYQVTKAGETIIEKRFYSNYKPWQAKFLRGVMPL